MLLRLFIKNYVLIRALEIELPNGLNILTGETGAGKSIILGAVGLLLGQRADTKTLNDSSEKCIIEGTFSIENLYLVKDILREEDLDDDSECIIRREITPQGKSRAFVNDTPVNLDVLRKLGALLLDIHSQHDTLLLASADFQLSLIDDYAESKLLLKEYEKDWHEYKEIERLHETLVKESESLTKEEDYNKFLLQELLEADLDHADAERWEKEIKAAEHSEQIIANMNTAAELTDRSESSALRLLRETLRILEKTQSFLPKLGDLTERLRSGIVEVEDIAREIESLGEETVTDPEKIFTLRAKLDEVYRLQQKHKVHSTTELTAIRDQLQEKTIGTERLPERIASLEQTLIEQERHLGVQAGKLSALRSKACPNIEKAIKELLADLGMPHAEISVRHEKTALGAKGQDKIVILFSANRGVQPQELKNVASGGEFSRLMLCVKYVMAKKTAFPTMIFDEIDTGISGETAIKVGKILQRMASKHQLIVITHLPQIAAGGEAHYFVYKDETSERSESKIRRLSKEERIREIAQMIGGKNPSPTAFKNAEELMGMHI